LRQKLKPEDIIVIVDSREQTPLDLAPMPTVKGTLTTGDYSISGMTHRVSVERKSLQDLVMCCGKERERFDREIKRLMAYEHRMILVEDSFEKILLKQYRGDMTPNAIVSSVAGWISRGVPIHFSGNRHAAADLLRRFLYITAQRYWSDCYGFMEQTSEDLKNGKRKQRTNKPSTIGEVHTGASQEN
jgi:DNA excision repair protein ERCC-4